MLETIRCPGCSTRFILSAERVRPGIRRAKCFRCASIFGIEEPVNRLLAPVHPPTEPAAEPALPPEPAPSLTLEDLQEVRDEGMEDLQEIRDEPMEDLKEGDDPSPGLPHPEQVPAPAEPLPGEPMAAVEAEAVAAADPADALPGTGGNYASAKDAIAKLMGNASVAPASSPKAHTQTMDVEATLDALESTLSGAPAPDQEPEARKSDLASTVKLTTEEIKVAMAAMGGLGDPGKPVAPMAPAPRMEQPKPDSAPAPAAVPVSAQSSELLKIQLEQETFNNITIQQMTAWIEQGRVHEYHMVARQHSDHWIEASKVPALHPVFDRMWKIRGTQPEEPPIPQPEPQPVKRGLFSGLFGRN